MPFKSYSYKTALLFLITEGEHAMTAENFNLDYKIERKNSSFFLSASTSNGREVCHGTVNIVTSNLNDAQFKSMAIGGIATDPEYRRKGLAKKLFMMMDDEIVKKEDCPISYLHPFSFSYYRMFGYERVSDHKILEFPMTALDFVPRFSDLIHCSDNSFTPFLNEIYNKFAENRNIMFKRDNNYKYPFDENRIYMSYDKENKPDGYIILESELYYNINRLSGVNLHIHELVFTSPDSLLRLLGFIRMFEGELDSVKIHDAAMSPEIEMTLRHYSHTKITIVPDIMARIHDVEKVFKEITYPESRGTFTVKIKDSPKTPFSKNKTEGTWTVRYENGKALDVAKINDDSDYDLAIGISELTQTVFGYNTYGNLTAKYLQNIDIKKDCADFFKAFPSRPSGLFEHF